MNAGTTRITNILVVGLSVLFIAGCQLGTRVQGKFYLNQERYSEGVETFRKKVQNNPFDSAANYYLGRYLLALDRPSDALPYLKEAVALDFSNADYHFWLGVCFHGLNNLEKERESYHRAIKYDGRHVKAQLYLSHSYLENGQWEKALRAYDRVLEIDHLHPQALYNRGLALNKLQRYPEEITAWKTYLAVYPEGEWAVWAVDHLNARGNFDYRHYFIGNQKVSLKTIRFEGSSIALSDKAKSSLDVIGSILSSSQQLELVIVCYKTGNKGLAENRARRIKNYLVDRYPVIYPNGLKISGINKPEKIEVGTKIFRLDDSVKFMTTLK